MSSNTSDNSKPSYISVTAQVVNKFKCCISSNIVDVDRENISGPHSPKNDQNTIVHQDTELQVGVEALEQIDP